MITRSSSRSNSLPDGTPTPMESEPDPQATPMPKRKGKERKEEQQQSSTEQVELYGMFRRVMERNDTLAEENANNRYQIQQLHNQIRQLKTRHHRPSTSLREFSPTLSAHAFRQEDDRVTMEIKNLRKEARSLLFDRPTTSNPKSGQLSGMEG
jgi:hypothetical protein